MTGKELITLLKKKGWIIDRIKGSHHILIKGTETLVVPVHGKKDPTRDFDKYTKESGVKMITYPAKIAFDEEDKAYNVSFPDLSGCFTYGESVEEAKENAKEALTVYLESIDLRKLKVPKASELKGEDIYYIEPESNVAFAIWLKQKREDKGYTQEEIAKILGIAYQTYQRFENPTKANPTLKTITKLEKVLNEKVLKL